MQTSMSSARAGVRAPAVASTSSSMMMPRVAPAVRRSGAVADRATFVQQPRTVTRAAAKEAKTATPAKKVDENNLSARHDIVREYFPTAMGVDDFIGRTETMLSFYGFSGDNSIACTNLCRDEVTAILKDKIEGVFGSSFMTNGLGGVITCGVTGFGAGLSHSPTCPAGKEKYVFFSFPHIAIDAQGSVGSISRPGRAGPSCACGAMAKALGEFKADGYTNACKEPGQHDALDPEYSILKRRLAHTLRAERADVSDLDLAKITAAAERTITADLEYLISKAVNLDKADYAVVTGVQIHNWASEEPGAAPSMEFVAPTKMYVVVNGVRTNLDVTGVPPLSPRQLAALAERSRPDLRKLPSTGPAGEVPYDYLMQVVRGGHDTSAMVLPKSSDWAGFSTAPEAVKK
uniref:Limiting CO2-inducible protein B/C beta carbonyic anhydrase domain-containing protein n=1 Tax=Chlamydomonas euryale TaxID=1486919 RepID=A0A7R9VTR2_9CHLO|mmetsp:Transcript_45059/g.134499  ORF Transcript_45059/g.134499 Transcript_45059/m.134499 type:complete len:404 (+) Transcript_45059:118-1329(+)